MVLFDVCLCSFDRTIQIRPSLASLCDKLLDASFWDPSSWSEVAIEVVAFLPAMLPATETVPLLFMLFTSVLGMLIKRSSEEGVIFLATGECIFVVFLFKDLQEALHGDLGRLTLLLMLPIAAP